MKPTKLQITAAFLVVSFLSMGAIYAEQPDFSESIAGIKTFDIDSDGKLSTEEFIEWEKGKGRDLYVGYLSILSKEVVKLFDADGDGFLNFEEVKTYETTWISKTGKRLRAQFIAEGKGAAIVVRNEEGKDIELQLDLLCERSQLRAFGNAMDKFDKENAGLDVSGKKRVRSKTLEEDPDHFFAKIHLNILGPGDGWNYTKYTKLSSDEEFASWLKSFMQLNQELRTLAILQTVNRIGVRGTGGFQGAGTRRKDVKEELVAYWKGQIAQDDQDPWVYVNAGETGDLHSSMYDGLVPDAALRGFKFHPRSLPILKLVNGLKYRGPDSPIPESFGGSYSLKDFLKAEQDAGDQLPTALLKSKAK